MSVPRAPRGGAGTGRQRSSSSTGHRSRGSARGNISSPLSDATHGRGRGNITSSNLRAGSSSRRGDATLRRSAGSRKATMGRASTINHLHRGAISNSWARRSAALKPNGYKSFADFMTAVETRYTELKAKRATDRAQAIQNGMLADPDKKVTLDQAITPVGTCTEMCPEFERVERMKQSMVDGAEKMANPKWDRDTPVEERMVKRFRRSAAGYDEQLPSDIRTPATLKMTLDYLFDEVIGKAENFAAVQKFVWDRTRSIRNDFSIQQVTEERDVAIAVECFERIARFHILSLHHLSKPAALVGGDYFDAHQEREQLNNTLLSLMYYYDDNRLWMDFQNEAEFRSYCIIFEIQSQHPDLEDRMQSWPKTLLEDKRVQTAFKLYSEAGNTLYDQGPLRPMAPFSVARGNSTGFWRLLGSKAVSYLMACVAEIYFGQVRYLALQNIWKNGKSSPSTRQGTEEWTIAELTNALAFDDDDQTIEFVKGFDLDLNTNTQGAQYLDFTSQPSAVLEKSTVSNKQIFSHLVEKKRMKRTLTAVANGLTAAQAIRQGAVDAVQQDSGEETANSTGEAQEAEESMFIPEGDDASGANRVNDIKTFSPFNPEALSFTPMSPSQNGLGNSPATNSIFGKPSASTTSSIFGKSTSLQHAPTSNPSLPSNSQPQAENTSASSNSFTFGQPTQVLSSPPLSLFNRQTFAIPAVDDGVSSETANADLQHSPLPPSQATSSSDPSLPKLSAPLEARRHELLKPNVTEQIEMPSATPPTKSLFGRVESPSTASSRDLFAKNSAIVSKPTGLTSNFDFARLAPLSSDRIDFSKPVEDNGEPSDNIPTGTRRTSGTLKQLQGFSSSPPSGVPGNGTKVGANDSTRTHADSQQAIPVKNPDVFGLSNVSKVTSQIPPSLSANGNVEGANSLNQLQDQSAAAKKETAGTRTQRQVDQQISLKSRAEVERYDQLVRQKEAELQLQEQEVTNHRISLDETTRTTQNKAAQTEKLVTDIKHLRIEMAQAHGDEGSNHARFAKQLEETVNNVQSMVNSHKASIAAQEQKDNKLRAEEAILRSKKLELEVAKLQAQYQHSGLAQNQQMAASSSGLSTSPFTKIDLMEQVRNNLSLVTCTEEHGLLQQFVEFACVDPIREAMEIYRQEREKEKIRPYREAVLRFKYGRRWTSLWWKRHMFRKGQHSRAKMSNLRQSVREEDRRKAELQAQQRAILEEAEISEDIKRQIRSNNEREQHERKEVHKTKPDVDKAMVEGVVTRVAHDSFSGRKRKSAFIDDLSGDSWRTYDPLGRRQSNDRSTSNKRSRPLSTSMVATNVDARIPSDSSTSSVAASHDTGASINPRVPRWTPQGGWRQPEPELRKSVNTTQTDYFRLKARGIDPETPLFPDTEKTLKEKRVREEQQARDDEAKSFASSLMKNNNDALSTATTLHVKSDSMPSNELPQSVLRANQILEGFKDVNKQIEKEIQAMREARLELQAQQEAKQQSRYSSSPRDRASSPLNSSDRSFAPGQMASVNGHAFMPSRSLNRTEARLRMTGGAGLAYRDPNDYEAEIKERSNRAKQTLKQHKPLTVDDVDKKYGFGKYAPGYVPTGNESPEQSDSGEPSAAEDSISDRHFVPNSDGRKRKHVASAAGYRKKRGSLDSPYAYESESDDEVESLEENDVAEANNELQYLSNENPAVYNGTNGAGIDPVIDPSFGFDASVGLNGGIEAESDADVESVADFHGYEQQQSGSGEDHREVYGGEEWEGADEYYDQDDYNEDGGPTEYDDEDEDDDEGGTTEEDGGYGLYSDSGGTRFTTPSGPGASQDDAIELSD